MSADVPRFEHLYNSSTGSVNSLGLLIEESRTNLRTYSNNFSTNWAGNISPTITANASTSPDGSTNATQISATSGGSGVYQFNNLTSGLAYTYSIFVKAVSGSNTIYFGTDAPGTTSLVQVNTSTGVASLYGGSPTNITSVSYPNSWYRIAFTFTASVTGTHSFVIYNLTASSNTWLIYGAQVEEGSFATSYIPAVVSTVTRSSDNASITGTNFSSWYNPSEGTVYADTKMVGVQTGRYDRLWAITNSNLNLEGISVFVAGPAGTPSGYVSSVTVTNSATEQVGGTLVESALTTPKLKSAFAFKQNDCASAYNGQQRFVDGIVDLSTFTTPPDRLFIGQPQRYQGYSCMTISQLTYYPRRLTNSQLTNLTK